MPTVVFTARDAMFITIVNNISTPMPVDCIVCHICTIVEIVGGMF